MAMTSTEPVVGVLLAGGQSRRMGGGDKCLLPLAGKPLLQHAIDRLRPQVTAVVLNANGDPARFARFGIDVVADSVAGFAGPLAGVLAGLRWARANHRQARWIVTAATDTPFFPRDLVARLLAAVGSQYPAIALAESDGRQHPVFGLWPTALADDLEAALQGGTRKVLDWTDRHPTMTAAFASIEIAGRSIDPFYNTNHPEELAEAEAMIASQS